MILEMAFFRITESFALVGGSLASPKGKPRGSIEIAVTLKPAGFFSFFFAISHLMNVVRLEEVLLRCAESRNIAAQAIGILFD